MLVIQMRVNAEIIDTIQVRNLGPTETADPDHPDSERLYRWVSHSTHLSGELTHWRGDGAHALAASVLEAIAEGQMLAETMQTLQAINAPSQAAVNAARITAEELAAMHQAERNTP